MQPELTMALILEKHATNESGEEVHLHHSNGDRAGSLAYYVSFYRWRRGSFASYISYRWEGLMHHSNRGEAH